MINEVKKINSYQKYFNRFEIKYQIPLKERDLLIKYIRPFMKLDSHVQNNHDYEVRSIYFDSYSRHSLFEKKYGIGIRRKLRLRYYPSLTKDNRELVFLEIKKKMNENVAKRTASAASSSSTYAWAVNLKTFPFLFKTFISKIN